MPLRDLLLDQIICASEQDRRAHVQLFGRNPRTCTLIHHGIDLERFTPTEPSAEVPSELGLARGEPVIGTIARLGERRHGIGDFVEMAVSVAGMRPEARFLVVRDGELRTRLESQTQEFGAVDRVIVDGVRTDTPATLALIDVLVMPSQNEARPYTPLEAMPMERPVVSTLPGFAPETVEDGQSGFLVGVGDIQAMSEAVLTLLSDDDLARPLGQRARCRVEQGSLATMVDATIRAFRGIG